ncbi:MAG: c-type cytochrome [Planctomycetaceae bacterium]|nr:c-type cytochrome [Planctomycetaceae bacterium]
MPRENLDDTVFDKSADFRRQLKRMAQREKERGTQKVVHEIDSSSGRSRASGKTVEEEPVRQPYRTFPEFHWTRTHTKFCLGMVMLLSIGYLGNRGWALWRHDSLVAEGEMLFRHEWTPDDPLSVAGDGLGPIFNAKSCVACHFQGGVGGAGSNEHNVTNFAALPSADRPKIQMGVVHTQAVKPAFLETTDKLAALFPIIKGKTTVRNGCTYRIPDFNPVHLATVSTPPLFGAGLVDTISTIAVEANYAKISVDTIVGELSGDYEGPALGRLRILSGGRVGKFGWKAQFASLEEFVAAACAMECGLSNPLKSQIEQGSFAADEQAELDMNRRMLTALVKFCEELPQPQQILPEDPHLLTEVRQGELLFAEIGCATCHSPEVGGVKGVYSDFLLHVVEEDYGDTTYLDPSDWQDQPLPNEWKTPPLWGVADSAPYWHDGSCDSLEQAITKHARQAKRVMASYEKLNAKDKASIISFLKTLRAPVLPESSESDSLLVDATGS